MLINTVAQKYNVSVRTLRYYEELGMISSTRIESNVRDFDRYQMTVLEEILVYKALDISLMDIKSILEAQDKHFLKDFLKSHLDEIENGILKLNDSRNLIQGLLMTYRSEDITKQNVNDFVKEKLFSKSKDERWPMMFKSNDLITVEIGIGLIPIAVTNEVTSDTNQVTSIIDAIKSLRSELTAVHDLKLDPIRLRDNPDELLEFEYQIKLNGEIVCKKTIDSGSNEKKIDHIMTNLKAVII